MIDQTSKSPSVVSARERGDVYDFYNAEHAERQDQQEDKRMEEARHLTNIL